MRHISTILSLCKLLALISCSKEDSYHAEPPTMVNISVVADISDATRIGVDGNKTHWEAGDRITLALKENSSSTTFTEASIDAESDISEDGKRAIFRGEVEARYYYGIAALYPAQSVNFNEVTLDSQAKDNIFMISPYGSSFIASEGAQLPIAFEHMMHKMDFKLSTAEGESAVDLNSDITIKVSAKNNGSTVRFVKSKKLNMKNLSPTVMEDSDQLIVQGSGESFSTMLFPMELNYNGTLIFEISVDGKQYEIVKGPFNKPFKMSAGKSTTVNLVLGEEDGNTGGGQTPTVAIKLTATETTIKANGVDATKFTVTQDGANVTEQSTIYVNESVLNGNRFITTTPGTYTVYAVKGEQKSNELTITAEEVTSTGKTIVFADGVTLTSGWYDVNKVGAGDNGDIQMCWAASASNIIQWWQDRYVAMGGTLPSTAVTGPGKDGTYELALMDLFHEEWDNMYGGFVFHAVPWYFEGKNVCQCWSYQAQPLTGNNGGYFKSAKFTYDKYMDFGYTSDINGYGHWGNGTSLEGVDRLKTFSDIVVESMDRGMASLTISLAENIQSLHHATTLWGYEIDNATGLLTRLWLTDSDNLTTEPKGQILHEFSVSIGEGKSHVKLSCPQIRYQNVWVVGIIPVSGPQL